VTENELLKKIAIAKAKPETLTDISPRDLADLVLVVLQYAKEINKQITEGKIKGDKGDNPIPDVDYLSLPTAQAELDKLQSQTVARILSDAKNALSQVRNGKDGKDGADGKNAEVTEEQIREASKLAFEMIQLPDFRVLITEQPEAIRDSLELLQDDERLDASAIKGLDELLKQYEGKGQMMAAGIRFMSQLADVRITSIANNDVLKWNSTTNLWENGASGGGTIDGTGTANELAYWTDADTLGTLAVATYPSLTELSYVKGVTSAIQTQLNGKAPSLGADDNYVTDAEKIVIGNTSGTNTGDQDITVKADKSGALTQFVGNTAWRVFYSDGSGDVQELALGADGTFLKSNGAALAPSFSVPAGTGDVSKVGTPVNNQVGVWTGDGTIEGDADLTFDTATNTLATGIVTVSDEAYGAGWNGSLQVPTKNALYDKIETLGGGSGITRTVVTTSGSITLGATASTDYTYYVAGAHTLSMPSPNTNRYTVKNLHSAAITIDTAGAELIEGAASLSLQPNDSVDIMSDSTNWYIH